MLNLLLKEVVGLANPRKAIILQRYFKTGPGEYGEGDIFLGITVPRQRTLAKKYLNLNFNEIKKLLHSQVHEHRFLALLILTDKFSLAEKNKNAGLRHKIFSFYLANTRYINNWDLVDLSAPKIVGAYLRNKDKKILYKLVGSKNLWERRIAVLATFDFICHGDAKDALKISKILIKDRHALIHKATGWMLREAGNRCGQKYLLEFLEKNRELMPRTMLRYSLERLPKKLRQKYLA